MAKSTKKGHKGGAPSFTTWEQAAKDSGVSVEPPPRPTPEELALAHEQDASDDPKVQAAIDKRKAWRGWSEVHNGWLQYVEGAGVTSDELDITGEKEHGKATMSSWQQQWDNALATDKTAQQFAGSKDFKAFTKLYGSPWLAFRNWQEMEHGVNDPNYGGNVGLMPNGLYYTGGPNGKWYDKFNRQVNSPPSFSWGGMTYDAKAGTFTDSSGQAVAHPFEYIENQGWNSKGQPGAQQVPNGQSPAPGQQQPGQQQSAAPPPGQQQQAPTPPPPPPAQGTQGTSGGYTPAAATGTSANQTGPTAPTAPQPLPPAVPVGTATGLGAGFSATPSKSDSANPTSLSGLSTVATGTPVPGSPDSIQQLIQNMAFQRLRGTFGFSPSNMADIYGFKSGGFAWGDVPAWLKGWRPQTTGGGGGDSLESYLGGGGGRQRPPGTPPPSGHPNTPPEDRRGTGAGHEPYQV
jgi:hypothetical protein